jgi:hypothetical protein
VRIFEDVRMFVLCETKSSGLPNFMDAYGMAKFWILGMSAGKDDNFWILGMSGGK